MKIETYNTKNTLETIHCLSANMAHATFIPPVSLRRMHGTPFLFTIFPRMKDFNNSLFCKSLSYVSCLLPLFIKVV